MIGRSRSYCNFSSINASGGHTTDAIVFGSGYVTFPQMSKSGFGLNIIGIVLTVVITYIVVIPLFSIVLGQQPAWIK